MLISLHDKVPFMEHAVKCVFAESLTFLNSGWFISGITVSLVSYSYYLWLFFFLLSTGCNFGGAVTLLSSSSASYVCILTFNRTGISLAYMSFLQTLTIILLNIPMRKNNIHAPFCWSKTVGLACCYVAIGILLHSLLQAKEQNIQLLIFDLDYKKAHLTLFQST